MLSVFIFTDLKQESVCLVTTKMIVKARIPELGLVPEVLPMTITRVETSKSEPWDTFSSSEKELTKKAQIDYFTQWGRLHHVAIF